MGCLINGGDNIKIENKMFCPLSRGVNAPTIARVATKYRYKCSVYHYVHVLLISSMRIFLFLYVSK